MSIRYGIDLALEPSFTATVHQTRRIVCDQYASWAAARLIVRMPLTPYFPCPDSRLPTLEAQVESIAQETANKKSYLLRRSVISADIPTSSVVLELEATEPLLELRRHALETARHYYAEPHPPTPFRPCITLLEYGEFPEAILLDAVQFAEGVASAVDMAAIAMPWRLLLTRYSSESAGEDWSNGRWAADLSCRQLHSHRLYAEVKSVYELWNMVKEQQSRDGGERKGIGRFFGRG